MKYIDLHTHSSQSDGSHTPTALVKEAQTAGLAAIALTDHDTVSGVEEAIAASQEYGVEVLSGVEISASHNGKPVHILGYGIDLLDDGLADLLDKLQKIRRNRNSLILEKLAEQGIMIDKEELAATTPGLIGRPHIARLLIERKAVCNFEQAFRKFLRKNGRAYVEAEKFPAAESIKSINRAGGVAVLAHPTTFDYSMKKIGEMVGEMTNNGLGGIEAFYPGHSTKTSRKLVELAAELNLLVTGGSDFHGSIKPGIAIGGAPAMPPVPYIFFEKILARLGADR
jgi:predicted metal-dependent phosphoesterase TrpH